LGILAALWVFVETLNAGEDNAVRIRRAAIAVVVFMCLSWVLAGYWYVNFYAPDKALILKGPWPWAHKIFMETKEHLFFIPLVLALYLPFATRERLWGNKLARNMVLTVSALIAASGFAIEGAGAVINYGVKVSLLQTINPGTKQ
jgi:hypothetical protein